MSINFYSMGQNCGWCVKAENLLQEQIKSGEIVKLPDSQAPSGVNGFPYFLNPANGLSHSGYPGDKQTLYNKLQYNGKQSGSTGTPRQPIVNSNVNKENFINTCEWKNKFVNNVNNSNCFNGIVNGKTCGIANRYNWYNNGTTTTITTVPNQTPCPSDTFNIFNYICPNCNLPKY
jgi:hypothetical protein